MKISAVIVTCNRLNLLQRALKSIDKQKRKPDLVYVISNSRESKLSREEEICSKFGFRYLKNYRTNNYAGALNTAIEEILHENILEDNLFFASLDDDDEWLPEYLQEIERHNDKNFDVFAVNCLRSGNGENILMTLPEEISENDFLVGNPGFSGSNTFVRLVTLLKAGCFDEALSATVDRDILFRIFQQNPSYKVIQKHLVTLHTDIDRKRITINKELKRESLQIFYHKYQCLMSKEEKEQFFIRAAKLFSISRDEIIVHENIIDKPQRRNIHFSQKGDYQFVIGFIAGNRNLAKRLMEQIGDFSIPVDLVIIIENLPNGQTLNACTSFFESRNIAYKIVRINEWKNKLSRGEYGGYFKNFKRIDSIPLGRTILHYHLFTETTQFKKPVYWIIDDDVSFSSTSNKKELHFDLFEIINRYINNADALIGGVSRDPPVPTLCCIRSQLLDFLHSNYSGEITQFLPYQLSDKPDYYYDLSDMHSDHLEIPYYYNSIGEDELKQLFSGKAVSRPALQYGLKSIRRTVTRRGPNTILFNRDALKYYPVINLEVDNKIARRGDLLWVIFNQAVSDRVFLEHTFSVDQNRPITKFVLDSELGRAAYDIIGYAFNKAFLEVIEKVKEDNISNRPKDIFEKLLYQKYYSHFLVNFNFFLTRRRVRFVMNYFRIIGLTKIIKKKFTSAESYYYSLLGGSDLAVFESILKKSQKNSTLKPFFENLTKIIWDYSRNISETTVDEEVYRQQLETFFSLKIDLRKLGSGAEGFVFTDEKFVYKIFSEMSDDTWKFLNEKSVCFARNPLLNEIDCFENNKYRFIRYHYVPFKKVEKIAPSDIVTFLKLCRDHDFCYTNIKPENFIQTEKGAIKLIDYGRSFEPFTLDKFVNSIKRAFLLINNPLMANKDFQILIKKINMGEDPIEIEGWQYLHRAIEPRKKGEILDKKIVSIIKEQEPNLILDYGCGKCKTARRLKDEIGAELYIFDIDKAVVNNFCSSFKRYYPSAPDFFGFFDIVLLNLVLCEINNRAVNKILTNVYGALISGGKAIVSICNPDFAHIHRTEFQNRENFPTSNSGEEILMKKCVYTGRPKREFFRSTKHYLDLFSKHGFYKIKTLDTDGVDIETLKRASDFKIFTMEK